MSRLRLSCFAIVAGAVTASCAGSYPPPNQRMADAMSAERSAQELGAATDPQGQLHLGLAQEQIDHAKILMESGDYRRAEFVLVRARSDAELALALAHAAQAKVEAQQAIQKTTALRMQNEQNLQPATPPQGADQGGNR